MLLRNSISFSADNVFMNQFCLHSNVCFVRFQIRPVPQSDKLKDELYLPVTCRIICISAAKILHCLSSPTGIPNPIYIRPNMIIPRTFIVCGFGVLIFFLSLLNFNVNKFTVTALFLFVFFFFLFFFFGGGGYRNKFL